MGLDQTAKVWDVETGMQLLDIDIFLNYVLTVDWSWDGSQFATAGYDGRAIVWDRATGREVARFEGQPTRNSALAGLLARWDPHRHLG